MVDTLTCPHCGAIEANVAVHSEATYVWSVMATAEIDIAADLVRDDKLKIHLRQGEWRGEPRRVLNEFRRDDDGGEGDRLSLIEWHELWLDHPDLVAFCWQCQGDVTEQFEALLNERVPLSDPEPTDDEIYNRVGVEGGIAYDTSADIPGSLGEHDWSL